MQVSLKTDGLKPSAINGCRLCGKPVVHESLCHYHHKEYKYEEWLDNTNPDDLGIVKWAKELLDKYLYETIGLFYEEGFPGIERYDRISDFTKNLAIVPTRFF